MFDGPTDCCECRTRRRSYHSCRSSRCQGRPSVDGIGRHSASTLHTAAGGTEPVERLTWFITPGWVAAPLSVACRVLEPHSKSVPAEGGVFVSVLPIGRGQ